MTYAHKFNDVGICLFHPHCTREAPFAIPQNEGVKYDADKPPYHLLPVYPIQCVTEVLQYGAKKYEDRNWEKGMSWSRLYRATLGHLFAWWSLHNLDKESGLQHLAHAATNILFLIEYAVTHPEKDDRPRRSVNV